MGYQHPVPVVYPPQPPGAPYHPQPARSAGIKHHQSAGSLLVEDAVATLATPDRVSRADLILLVTVATDVDGDASLGLFLLVHGCRGLWGENRVVRSLTMVEYKGR